MFGSIKKNSRHLHINDHHNSNITGNANEANSTDSKPGVRHLQNQLNPKINKPRQASNHNIESLGHNNNDKTGTFIGNHNNNNGHNFHLRNGSGDNIASKPNNTGTNVDMFDSNYNGYQLLNRPTISIPVQNDTYSYKQTKVPNKLKNVQDQHIPVISTNKPNGSYRNQGNKDREKKTVSVEQDKHSHAQVHSQFYKNQYINGNGNQQKQIEQINKYFNNESDNEQADILQG